MAASLLYEFLVIFAIALIGFLLPQVALSGFGMQSSGRLLWLHIFVLLGIYFIWCWTQGGQTLPMKTWKIQVLNPDGSPLRPLQALLRYCAAWLSCLLLGLGFALAFFDARRRSLHDRIAGTQIYIEPADSKHA